MKKIIKKFFTPFAVFAMAIGIAVSVNAQKDVVGARASEFTETVTLSPVASPVNNTTQEDYTNFSIFHYKGTDANFRTSDSNRRIYKANILTFVANENFKISKVVVNAESNQYATAFIGGWMNFEALTSPTNPGNSTNNTSIIRSASGSKATISHPDGFSFLKIKPSAQTRVISFEVTYFSLSTTEFGELTGISVNTASAKLTYNVEDEFSSAGITAFAYDNSDPVVSKMVTDDVVYSAEGHIFVAEDVGTYTVTVSYTELEIIVSTTFDVEVLPAIVFDHAGTLEDPYSPADAIKVAEKTGEIPTTESFYIKGIISLVKSVDTGTYGNAEFEIKENLSDSVKFLIYRAFANSDGAPFTTATAADIKVGYEVVVYGKIVNYKGNTPETNAGSKNTANTTHVVSIDKTAATEAANAFAVNFNSAIGAICSLDGESDLVALEAEWLVQKAAFNDLVEGSRILVKASAANSTGSDLEQFTAKYIFIANKYQSLENFVARTEVVAGVNDTVRNTNSNQMVYSLVIGLIGITTLVGFYFINKKKQINN